MTKRIAQMIRWLDLIACGMVVGFGCWFLRDATRVVAEWTYRVMPEPRSDSFLFLSAFAILLLAWILWRIFAVRPQHLTRIGYPSCIWAAGTSAVMLVWLLPRAVSMGWRFPVALLFLLAVTVIVRERLMRKLRTQLRKGHNGVNGIDSKPVVESGNHSTEAKALTAKMSEDDFLQWLAQEEPIDSEKYDILDFRSKAKRIADRFRRTPEASIGIIGPFGAGKTSLARLVERELHSEKKPRFVFVFTSCWGFESASKAEEQILAKIIEALSKEVDCLAFRRLPESYLKSVKTGCTWFDSVIGILPSVCSPQERLEMLEPLLAAAGIQVVVVLEDIERTRRSFRIDEIQALVDRLKNVRGISLVMNAVEFTPFASKHQGLEKVDLQKLCHYLYDISCRDDEQWFAVLKRIRTIAFERYKNDEEMPRKPARSLHGMQAADVRDAWEAGMTDAISERTWIGEAVGLCGSIRELKSAARATLSAWDRLHGEVDFNELLMINLLRQARPKVLNILHEYVALGPIRCQTDTPRSQSDAEEQKAQKQSEDQKSAEKEYAKRRRRAFKQLFDHYVDKYDPKQERLRNVLPLLLPDLPEFPNPKAFQWQETLQGFYTNIHRYFDATRQTNYWTRILEEEIPEGDLKDQAVLKEIRQWAEDPTARSRLAPNILQDKPWARKVEQFHWAIMNDDYFLLLVSQYLEVLRNTQGNRASGEYEGFRLLLGAAAERQIDGEHIVKWVNEEVNRSIKVSLQLVNDLAEGCANAGLSTIVQTGVILGHIAQTARTTFATLDALVAVLPSENNNALWRIVHRHRIHPFGPMGSSGTSDWSFLADVILNGIAKENEDYVRQLVTHTDGTIMQPFVQELFGADAGGLLQRLGLPAASANNARADERQPD